MCKKDFKIHFCTCSNKQEINIDFADEVVKLYELKKFEASKALFEKNGSYEDTYFKWTLSSFQEKVNKNRVMGMMIHPQNKISKELTIDSILEALNSGNAFDFNYVPKEKDFIKIEEKYQFIELDNHRRPAIIEYISFKFESGKWIFGRYPIHYRHKEAEIGKVKTVTLNL
ncbi:hypothetical protein [Tenacibaculum ovolyticum]|uniref:hypothetical protein n=1 Tax=Tenacibaculum ovolyticum TaxID=104270 RepID=UPI001F44A6A9|nr:hypothetical protein [Tenacibaculum ovolyticum]